MTHTCQTSSKWILHNSLISEERQQNLEPRNVILESDKELHDSILFSRLSRRCCLIWNIVEFYVLGAQTLFLFQKKKKNQMTIMVQSLKILGSLEVWYIKLVFDVMRFFPSSSFYVSLHISHSVCLNQSQSQRHCEPSDEKEIHSQRNDHTITWTIFYWNRWIRLHILDTHLPMHLVMVIIRRIVKYFVITDMG